MCALRALHRRVGITRLGFLGFPRCSWAHLNNHRFLFKTDNHECQISPHVSVEIVLFCMFGFPWSEMLSQPLLRMTTQVYILHRSFYQG